MLVHVKHVASLESSLVAVVNTRDLFCALSHTSVKKSAQICDSAVYISVRESVVMETVLHVSRHVTRHCPVASINVQLRVTLDRAIHVP